jgi:hypothetical protein
VFVEQAGKVKYLWTFLTPGHPTLLPFWLGYFICADGTLNFDRIL